MTGRMTLAIVGSVEQMECGGSGCERCPYAASLASELACRVEVPDEPQSLARVALRDAGVEPPASPNLGHAADEGHVYDVEELEPLAAFLESALCRLPGDDRWFNARIGLENSLHLVRKALAHRMRVILEV